jgi:hypothetical protein
MPTGLMQLSPELRNYIYELVLVEERPIHSRDRKYRRVLDLGLLLVNKTNNREASPIFYGQNQFEYAWEVEPIILKRLVDTGDNAALIRHIWLDLPRMVKKSQSIFLNGEDKEVRDEIQFLPECQDDHYTW